MSIGKTKKEPLKGPAAPYDGYDEREDTEEKVRQALAFDMYPEYWTHIYELG